MTKRWRRPLSIHEIRERLEERVHKEKEVHLRWETAFILLEALRAYTANPKTTHVARILCREKMLRDDMCQPPCRTCLSTAADIKALYRGELFATGEGSHLDNAAFGRKSRKER